jgi:hypothetical protein
VKVVANDNAGNTAISKKTNASDRITRKFEARLSSRID